MKNTILVISALLSFITTQATIRTVNNSTGGAGQYLSLQAALDASAAYDTVYIHASDIIYPQVYVVRPVVIFGEGALPDQQSLDATYIDRINFYFSEFYDTNASGSKIYGCKIGNLHLGTGNVNCNCNTSWYNSASYGVNNITIERCEIGNLKMTSEDIGVENYALGIQSNIVVKNNIIRRLEAGVMRNCLIANNIIGDPVVSGNPGVESYNNVFVNNTILGTYVSFSGAQVNNNLFMTILAHSGNLNIYGWNSALNKNVFSIPVTLCTDCGVTASTNVFAAGNIVNEAVWDWSNSTGQIWNSGYSNQGPFPDFHLLNGSVGSNYGTDNTDVGIYGGPFVWVDYLSPSPRYRYYAPPKQLPVLQEVNVLNSVVSPTGNINIQVKAKSQN
jgi:hypothetical protein